MYAFLYSTVGVWCQPRTPTNHLITNLRQNRHPFRDYLEKGHFDDIFVATCSKHHENQNIITNQMKIRDSSFNIVFEKNIKFGVLIRFACFVKTPFTRLVGFCHHKLKYHKKTNIIPN